MEVVEMIREYQNRVLGTNKADFENLALELYRFQSKYNPVYREYIQSLGRDPEKAKTLRDITFLPISFFKTHKVATGNWIPEKTFESSGTTGMETSKHHVFSLEFYLKIAEQIFQEFYGPLEEYSFLGLLPSYLERDNSSLVAMVKHFIDVSGHGGFYLNNHEALLEAVDNARKNGKKCFIIGVTFGLLDLAEQHDTDLSDCVIMETGGMKGRRKEMVRQEVHDFLGSAFNSPSIHSEYGMTELLSQAYSKGEGIFQTKGSMRILLRESTDPFSYINKGSGGINVIDLANVHSCCFIETQDIGRIHPDGQLEILGRFDNSDVRGCSLMAV
ncbi:acyltransferase [Fulvitalea axinellae]|uniref:Acyltransferase n=1 Tax=Fulvitalea axinellae TaxID=1182444 RepID=A0AAU9CL65_9BACT|nr:acyltransferase [Fulvitalea axinellae]